MKKASLFVRTRFKLSEHPEWDQPRNRLLWTDIDGGGVYAYHADTGALEQLYQGPKVGAFTQQGDGSLILFRESDVAWLSPEGKVQVLWKVSDPGMVRFNDVIADPAGRVFAGTIAATPGSAVLYQFEPDGEFDVLFRNATCPNGMGFSPDMRTFYWTRSSRRQILAFDYDVALGALSNERVFVQFQGDPKPDGLAVDSEGCIWSAVWGAGMVVRFEPKEGREMSRIEVPSQYPTSLCFWGAQLELLAITSERPHPEADTDDGCVFLAEPGVKGVLPFLSHIVTAGEPQPQVGAFLGAAAAGE